MYVDDGILFACADSWETVQNTLRSRYAICEEWLRRVGLAAEPDKTELLYFQKPFERNVVPACSVCHARFPSEGEDRWRPDLG
jgi:hypothetical protein